MKKCLICERRPARKGGCCAQCGDGIERERNTKKANVPAKFLTYRGHVIGLYPNGGGMLTARLLRRKPEGLPKSRTLDLNAYCEGYTRKVIKAFKAAVLQLTNA